MFYLCGDSYEAVVKVPWDQAAQCNIRRVWTQVRNYGDKDSYHGFPYRQRLLSFHKQGSWLLPKPLASVDGYLYGLQQSQ